MYRKLLLACVLSVLAPAAAFAAECSVDLEGNDAMKYNLTNIDISRSCTNFTINLKHVGTMAKNVMGHNVVIARTADMQNINNDGIKAGLANDYIKPNDTRIVAHSKLIGGGESTSVTIPVNKLTNGPYSFFCSFPAHFALMKGTITLKP